MTTYRPLTAETVLAYLDDHPSLKARLGGDRDAWTAREVSDGNLNTVFIVTGPAGSLCCKQSLPYVRVDPGWAMPLERTLFEARWMQTTEKTAKGQIPALYHVDEGLFLIVMENLGHHRVLRDMLIGGTAPAGFGARIGEFIGHAAFATSWRALPFEDVFALREIFSRNLALTRITVDLVFTDPYRESCGRNRWLSPDLDVHVRALQQDHGLRLAVERLQERFLSVGQNLLHGDLHTGSVMVEGDDVRVIDGEFALYGPLGFDLGMFIANLAINAYAQPGHSSWIDDEIRLVWNNFRRAYLDRWDESGLRGDVDSLTRSAPSLARRTQFFQEVIQDVAGFAGLELIRRTIGFAQVADYDAAPDRLAEAEARMRAMSAGRVLISDAARIDSPQHLLDYLRL